jgi:hypothetical protein
MRQQNKLIGFYVHYKMGGPTLYLLIKAYIYGKLTILFNKLINEFI